MENTTAERWRHHSTTAIAACLGYCLLLALPASLAVVGLYVGFDLGVMLNQHFEEATAYQMTILIIQAGMASGTTLAFFFLARVFVLKWNSFFSGPFLFTCGFFLLSAQLALECFKILRANGVESGSTPTLWGGAMTLLLLVACAFAIWRKAAKEGA